MSRPAVVTPSTSGASGKSDTKSPGAPIDRQRPAAVDEPNLARAVREDARHSRSAPACASSSRLAIVCSSRAPPNAPTTSSDVAPALSASQNGQLRVALVLGRGMDEDLGAAARSRSTSAGARSRRHRRPRRARSRAPPPSARRRRRQSTRSGGAWSRRARSTAARDGDDHRRQRSGLSREVTPFAGTNQIRFLGSAVVPHSQRLVALPCPVFELCPILRLRVGDLPLDSGRARDSRPRPACARRCRRKGVTLEIVTFDETRRTPPRKRLARSAPRLARSSRASSSSPTATTARSRASCSSAAPTRLTSRSSRQS